MKYPLSEVPFDCIKVQDVADPTNPENQTEQDYLDAEYEYEIICAVERVMGQGDAWRTELRGRDLQDAMNIVEARTKCQKNCSEVLGGCGSMNENRHGICRFCGSSLPTLDKINEVELKRIGQVKALGHDTLKKAPMQRARRTEAQKIVASDFLHPTTSYDYIDTDDEATNLSSGEHIPCERRTRSCYAESKK